jgi:mRNA-degrading endonuclease RelE of RelBE toxin-antitoxin system
VKIEWSPAARASARRYMADQDGMRAIGGAIAQLAGNPDPPEAFDRGDYHRLRVGSYGVVYIVEDDLVTIERVDRIT